ncbi:orcokinin peptides type B-like [Wyeomyia smithii]|uniref:orcokinin peptides type B-like n=1 Tax=Wyeomyia smithii TaxID=174621 RepID=UPI00246807D8|nr:orcokinin peptides type B-like [Wyeomyia smithii]
MFKFHVVCVVLLVVACLAWTEALPVKEQGVEDLIDRLQQLKQLNDEYLYFNRILLNGGTPMEMAVAPSRSAVFGRNQRSLDSIGGGNLLKRSLDSIGGGNLLKKSPNAAVAVKNKASGEKERSHLATMKTKRSLNNSDRRTLLYQYYARGLAPMYDKRNFDEIDRFSKFNAKRNIELADMSDRLHAPSKRQFDEIDRYANFNNRLGRSMADYVKRNFDEIDRYGKFNKRPFREVENLDSNGFNQDTSQLADEMGVINEYAQ